MASTYGRRPEFSETVKRVRLAVAMNYERRLNRDRCAGAIFALKSMVGWRDQVEVKVTGVMANLDMAKLPHDLIQQIANPPATNQIE